MTIESLVIFLLVGAVAGFIAAKLTRGAGMGLLLNMAVGVVGAYLGGWLLRLLGVSFRGGLFGVPFAGVLGTLLTAIIGAVALLAILGLITGRARPTWYERRYR